MDGTENQEALAHANLLIFEIGNSHISVGTAIKGAIRSNVRHLPDQMTEVIETAGESWEALPEDHIKGIAAASVVGSSLDALRERMADRFGVPLRVVGEDLHRPMSLAVDSPEQVGIDRVCAAAAAYDVIRGPCAVASFGTAVTVDCVNSEGAFLGGAILPGVNMQARSLYEGTDALPHVIIEPTGTAFGMTTEQAIRNGVLVGLTGALRELTERYATELGTWPQLVLTGGNAELIASQCDFVDSVVPDLCMRGIALAFRRHFAPFDREAESDD